MKSNFKTSWFTVFTFVRINTKRFFRDRTAIFFTILFPLIFLFVFGSINNGGGDVSFNVAIINNSQSEFAKGFVTNATKDTSEDGGKKNILKVNQEITNIDDAKQKMNRSELDATIILPKEFGEKVNGQTYPSGELKVLYTQNNQQSAIALTSILEGQFRGVNNELVPSVTPFTVVGEQLNEKSLSAFDYTFAGLLGFAIIGMGIFGPINVFPELKKMGILRRLSTTPLKVWQYFVSTMIGQAIIGLVSIAVMFAVAIAVFHLEVVGNWAELIVFVVFSIIMILGIGLALGGWAKNERQVAPLANIIVFPMMFLSGTFFPRFLMPEWLQNISAFLPLTPVIDGIRLITTEGLHLIDILPQIGLVGAWMVVIYIVAFKVFRWE
jgi:ABC-2 type transport system permease protein